MTFSKDGCCGGTYLYNARENEFSVVSCHGDIVTFFRPRDGMDYWYKLLGLGAAANLGPHFCACCGQYIIIAAYDLCPVCGWEADPVQNCDPDYAGGANKLSLQQHRQKKVTRHRLSR